MAENALAAEARTETGKGVARKLRAAGRIPAVMYGRGTPSKVLSLDPEALLELLHQSGAGRNTLINLEVDGGSHTVLLKELQRDPVTGASVHADFFLVDLAKTVEVTVQLRYVGKVTGLDFGGILDHPVRELLIECLPTAIPESIEVSMEGLELGQTIHVNQVTLPEGAVCKTEGDLAVATCTTPKVVEEEEVAEEGIDEVLEDGAEPTETPESDADADTEGKSTDSKGKSKDSKGKSRDSKG